MVVDVKSTAQSVVKSTEAAVKSVAMEEATITTARATDMVGGGDSGYGEERRHGNNEYNDRPSQGYGGGGRDDYNDRPSQGYSGGGGSYGDDRRHESSYGGQQHSSEGGYGGQQHSSGTSYGGGGHSSDDFSGAAEHASSHAGGSGDSDLFSTALGLLGGKKSRLQEEDVDEDDAVKQHQKLYGGGNDNEQASSGSVGTAAAMQALKMFTGGNEETGKGGQNKFIGLAMGQAAQLFDQQSSQGKTQPGATKQDAVAQAAQMALKFYMKSEMGGGGASGGGSSGGVGGLMNLASKFLK
ncbi:hypothetical protein N0V90_012177 [Kalmusia sp. IMI 367209]|nr:hypothetical protein N0V90_012177 [Kalmusia sp. IMI 367209]